jgi:hypothetical protein
MLNAPALYSGGPGSGPGGMLSWLRFSVPLGLTSKQVTNIPSISSPIHYSTFWNNKFWEELNAYFPLIRYGLHRKRRLQQYPRCRGNVLPSRCLATIGGYRHTDYRQTMFHKDWFSHSKVDGRGGFTDTQTSNTSCPHTSCKVHWFWRRNFRKKKMYYTK